MQWLAESVNLRDAISGGNTLRATRVKVDDGYKWQCGSDGTITRDEARKFLADEVVEAVKNAVKCGKPEHAQTLTIQVTVRAEIAEAAAKEQ